MYVLQKPCSCGYAGDAEKTCTCAPSVLARYQTRISGPLLDRVDIQRQDTARERQEARSGAIGRALRRRARAGDRRALCWHGHADHRRRRTGEVRAFCQFDGAGQPLMSAAMRRLHMSARADHRVLKLARMIADLADVLDFGLGSPSLAISY
jgi:magnesium chelatase family protein